MTKIRLVSVNGELVPPKLVENDNTSDWANPQKMLDLFCATCFRYRSYYLEGISDQEPFNIERAKQILEIMIQKGTNDPKAYSLGNMIRRNWHRFQHLP